MSALNDVNKVAGMIASGKKLLLAGSAKALAKLPPGQWVGGTIPYFMTESGGCRDDDRVFVTEIGDYSTSVSIKTYTDRTLKDLYKDAPANGFSVIVIPSTCPAHYAFALEGHEYPGFAIKPLIGWIAGVAVEDIGKAQALVYDGTQAEPMPNGAVVMHVGLPDNKYAEINIVNSFTQGDGDVICFPEDGFSATQAIINGKTRSLAEYLKSQEIDTRLPLVADYCGSMINTSFLEIDADTGKVTFVAPVFNGMEYRIAAAPQKDYVDEFASQIAKIDQSHIFWSCNCILNYLYAGLEGKKTGTATGPMTFGEIAYQLLNQTMVYLSIIDS
jgi:hypothetical protein